MTPLCANTNEGNIGVLSLEFFTYSLHKLEHTRFSYVFFPLIHFSYDFFAVIHKDISKNTRKATALDFLFSWSVCFMLRSFYERGLIRQLESFFFPLRFMLAPFCMLFSLLTCP